MRETINAIRNVPIVFKERKKWVKAIILFKLLINKLFFLCNAGFKMSLIDYLPNWMGKLPVELRNFPFIHLAIPGTHDSMTYAITSHSEFSPDAGSLVQHLQCLLNPFRGIFTNWSKTQEVDTKTQLENGVRYFDMRVATKNNTDEIYYCHALYADSVTNVFNQILTFLNAHTDEVVFLDFQHFYGFNYDTHERLLNKIDQTFGSKILKASPNLASFTLNYMSKNRFQVLCIYRSYEGANIHWSDSDFPTPWPQTTVPSRLFKELDYDLSNRNMENGYISQCVLTATPRYIAGRLYSSIKHSFALRIKDEMIDWLKKQSPGEGKLNITICDFADLDDWIYSKTVINLNLKLIQTSMNNYHYPSLHAFYINFVNNSQLYFTKSINLS